MITRIYDLDYIDEVEKFMKTTNQPMLNEPTQMPEDRNKLRIALIFEELKEYAEASGLSDYFTTLSEKAVIEFNNDADNDSGYKSNQNLVQQLDALVDLQYVLTGAVIESGMQRVFNHAFNEVHRSNMSKFCDNEDDAKLTLLKYKDENIEVYQTKIENNIVTYRKDNNKVVKGINYSEPDLEQFINL